MSITAATLNKNYQSFFEKFPIKKDCNIVVAFSGGTDSVALSLSLQEYFPEKKIILAHVSHGIRDGRSQKREDRFVSDFAKSRDFLLVDKVFEFGEIATVADKEGLSLEEAARNKRYEFFYSVLNQYDEAYIFLGHHLDDQSETQVMRFFQGSGPRGLRGIAPCRDRYLRPLLNISKSTLSLYLEEKGAGHIEDESNGDNQFLRNRVRNELIPLLNDIFPGYKGSLANLSEKMTQIQDLIEKQTNNELHWNSEGNDSFSIKLDEFFKAPEILRRESLYELANKTIKDKKRIPYGFFTILNTCQIKSGTVFLRGFGYRLIHRNEYVFWERDVVFPSKNSYLISIIKDVEKLLCGKVIKVQLWQDAKLIGETDLSIRCEPPFVMRSRRIGDKISLSGGSKSLKKLFNQWKVPEELRWQLPVFEDTRGILGVLGEPWGFPNIFCDRTSGDIWCITWAKEIIGG